MYLHVVAYFLVCGFVLPFPRVIFYFFFLGSLQIFVQLLLVVRFAMPHLNFANMNCWWSCLQCPACRQHQSNVCSYLFASVLQ